MSTNLTSRSSGNMRLPALLIGVGLIILTAFLALQNWQNVSMSAFIGTFQLPLAAVGLVCLTSGCLAGYAINFGLGKTQVQSQKKLEEWQAQDVKLAASLVSDKEKQLEAKVATLEAALKSALKKSM